MSAAAVFDLPFQPFGPIIRQAARERSLKDREYRKSPVGHLVGRYIDGLKLARRAQNTQDSYEQVLAWFSQWFDDVSDLSVFCEASGGDRLEEFIALKWGDSAAKTLAQRWQVIKTFFDWAKLKGLVPFNPMLTVPKPRNPRTVRERVAYEQHVVHALIDAQEPLRDRCALGLLRLAIRKNDLRMLQLRDIDLARDVVRLNHGKGGERHHLPIVFPSVVDDLRVHLAERTLIAGEDPSDEYLLFPRDRRERPMDPASIHRWFKRCLENAGLPTSMQMHELRHTALDHMWRTTGNIVLAQKLARHKSPATTAGYLHPTDDDLRAGLWQVVRSEERSDD